MRKKPELLLPAGGFERMRVAFDFGADAVYAGQPRYSLRARNNEFKTPEDLASAIEQAHARGKKFYLAANVLAHNAKTKTFLADLEACMRTPPDALIMADPGMIMKTRERLPDMPIHLSVQANATNSWDAQFWRNAGVSRVILSRELSIEEIKEIRDDCPDVELEVFVHGALCVAYSGRCLLSGYFNHRDANQGACTNACRWKYKVGRIDSPIGGAAPRASEGNLESASANETSQTPNPSAPCDPEAAYGVEQEDRPGEIMPIEEDEHGAYVFNSKDLRAIELVGRLMDAGVDSLKIEGRTKSAYYVARTAQSYRKAIDDAAMGKPFDPGLLADLEGLANRGYTSGFLERHRPQDYQNYLLGHSVSKRSRYVGAVTAVGADGWADVDVKNRFAVGDRLEIIHPSGNQIVTLGALRLNGVSADAAPGNGVAAQIPDMAGKEGALIARLLRDDETGDE